MEALIIVWLLHKVESKIDDPKFAIPAKGQLISKCPFGAVITGILVKMMTPKGHFDIN